MPRKVAVVGVGNIGAPIARSIIRAGFDVLACDVDPAKLARLADDGARTTSRIGACAGEDIIAFLLATDAQLSPAIAELRKSLDPARPPVIVLMGTTSPQLVRDIARDFNADGIQVVDAPVSGGAVRAERGDLSIMVGGEASQFDHLRPFLSAIGSTIHHCGPLGSGQLTKIVNNMVGVTTMFLMAEAMKVADAHGFDPAIVASIMEQSSGRNHGTINWRDRTRLYRTNSLSREAMEGILTVCRKDLQLGVGLAEAVASFSPILHAASTTLNEMPLDDVHALWSAVGGMYE